MPKIIEIAEGGATEEQLDDLVDHFISLPVSRDRQPTLIFDDADGKPQTYTRTSRGQLLFGSILVKDRQGLRTLLAGALRGGRTTVGVGLLEGSAAREYREEESPRAGNRGRRRSNRR